jgi:hypothetical protein
VKPQTAHLRALQKLRVLVRLDIARAIDQPLHAARDILIVIKMRLDFAGIRRFWHEDGHWLVSAAFD